MLSKRKILKTANTAVSYSGETLWCCQNNSSSSSAQQHASNNSTTSGFVNIHLQSSLVGQEIALGEGDSGGGAVTDAGRGGETGGNFYFSSFYGVSYSPTLGVFSCYDLYTRQKIASVAKPLKSGSKLAHACFSALSDGMFFYSFEEDPSLLYSLLVSPNKVEVSAGQKLNRNSAAGGFPEKYRGKGALISLVCHPSKQLLFAAFQSGVIQAWSYVALFRSLVIKGGGAATATALSSGYGGGGTGDYGSGSAAAATEDDDDNSTVDGGPGIATGSGLQQKTHQPTKQGKVSSHALINPFSILWAPTTALVKIRSAGTATAAGNNGSASAAAAVQVLLSKLDDNHLWNLPADSKLEIDASGHYAAIVFQNSGSEKAFGSGATSAAAAADILSTAGGTKPVTLSELLTTGAGLNVTCLYDLSGLNASFNANNGVTQISAVDVCGMFMSPFAADIFSSAFPATAIESYALGPMCFHPSKRFFFQTVLRRRRRVAADMPLFTQKNNDNNKSATTAISRTTLRRDFEPLPPVILAVSLLNQSENNVKATLIYHVTGPTNGSNGGGSSRHGGTPTKSLTAASLSSQNASLANQGSGFESPPPLPLKMLNVIDCYEMTVSEIEGALFCTASTSASTAPAYFQSVNMYPLSAHCTPVSSVLALSFEAAHFPAAAHNRYSDSNNEVPRPSQSRIHVLYDLDEYWVRRQGLTPFLGPLVGSVAVPPDAFLWGDTTVLSATARYKVISNSGSSSSTSSAAAAAASTGSNEEKAAHPSVDGTDLSNTTSRLQSPTATFALLEPYQKKGSARAAVVQLPKLPLLLSIKPTYVVATGSGSLNTSNPAVLCQLFYHLFQIDWSYSASKASEAAAVAAAELNSTAGGTIGSIAAEVGSTNAKTGQQHQQGGGRSMPLYVGSIPAELDETSLARSKRKVGSSWLQLDSTRCLPATSSDSNSSGKKKKQSGGGGGADGRSSSKDSDFLIAPSNAASGANCYMFSPVEVVVSEMTTCCGSITAPIHSTTTNVPPQLAAIAALPTAAAVPQQKKTLPVWDALVLGTVTSVMMSGTASPLADSTWSSSSSSVALSSSSYASKMQYVATKRVVCFVRNGIASDKFKGSSSGHPSQTPAASTALEKSSSTKGGGLKVKVKSSAVATAAASTDDSPKKIRIAFTTFRSACYWWNGRRNNNNNNKNSSNNSSSSNNNNNNDCSACLVTPEFCSIVPEIATAGIATTKQTTTAIEQPLFSVLALSSCGFKLKWLRTDTRNATDSHFSSSSSSGSGSSGSGANTAATLLFGSASNPTTATKEAASAASSFPSLPPAAVHAVWNIGVEMSDLWASPVGSRNTVLLASEPVSTSGSGVVGVQYLYGVFPNTTSGTNSNTSDFLDCCFTEALTYYGEETNSSTDGDTEEEEEEDDDDDDGDEQTVMMRRMMRGTPARPIALQEGERVVAVKWQPVSSVLGTRSAAAVGTGSGTGSGTAAAGVNALSGLREQQSVWSLSANNDGRGTAAATTDDDDDDGNGNAGGSGNAVSEGHETSTYIDSLVGVLTNRRVLIIRVCKGRACRGIKGVNRSRNRSRSNIIPGCRYHSHLRVLSSTITYSEEGGGSGGGSKPISISWVGGALCYASDNGHISYLVPGCASTTSSSSAAATSDSHMLCSLPRNLSCGAGNGTIVGTNTLDGMGPATLRIGAVLGDRLLLCHSRRSALTGLPIPIITSRPVVPLEPLVLALLAMGRSWSSGNNSEKDIYDVIARRRLLAQPINMGIDSSDSGGIATSGSMSGEWRGGDRLVSLRTTDASSFAASSTTFFSSPPRSTASCSYSMMRRYMAREEHRLNLVSALISTFVAPLQQQQQQDGGGGGAGGGGAEGSAPSTHLAQRLCIALSKHQLVILQQCDTGAREGHALQEEEKDHEQQQQQQQQEVILWSHRMAAAYGALSVMVCGGNSRDAHAVTRAALLAAGGSSSSEGGGDATIGLANSKISSSSVFPLLPWVNRRGANGLGGGSLRLVCSLLLAANAVNTIDTITPNTSHNSAAVAGADEVAHCGAALLELISNGGAVNGASDIAEACAENYLVATEVLISAASSVSSLSGGREGGAGILEKAAKASSVSFRSSCPRDVVVPSSSFPSSASTKVTAEASCSVLPSVEADRMSLLNALDRASRAGSGGGVVGSSGSNVFPHIRSTLSKQCAAAASLLFDRCNELLVSLLLREEDNNDLAMSNAGSPSTSGGGGDDPPAAVGSFCETFLWACRMADVAGRPSLVCGTLNRFLDWFSTKNEQRTNSANNRASSPNTAANAATAAFELRKVILFFAGHVLRGLSLAGCISEYLTMWQSIQPHSLASGFEAAMTAPHGDTNAASASAAPTVRTALLPLLWPTVEDVHSQVLQWRQGVSVAASKVGQQAGSAARPKGLLLTPLVLLINTIVQHSVNTNTISSTTATNESAAASTTVPSPPPPLLPLLLSCLSSSRLFLADIEARQRDAATRRSGNPNNLGVGLGPAPAAGSGVGVLALDQVEEYMGANSLLETCAAPFVADELFEGAAGGAGGFGSGEGEGEDDPSYCCCAVAPAIAEATNGPSSGGGSSPVAVSKVAAGEWVSGVGTGTRDTDRVVGYWRFSDIILQGESGFVSSSRTPGARALFLDLSRYCEEGSNTALIGAAAAAAATSTSKPSAIKAVEAKPAVGALKAPVRRGALSFGLAGGKGSTSSSASSASLYCASSLELCCPAVDSVKIEFSTSLVDPGERHEAVRSLYDVVYLATTSAAATGDGGGGGWGDGDDAWGDSAPAFSSTDTGAKSDNPFGDDDGWAAAGSTSSSSAVTTTTSSSSSSRSADLLSFVTGMRCRIPRGSQLDIGLFHKDPSRCRLTAEVSVCFDLQVAGAAEAGASTANHVLMQRNFHRPSHCVLAGAGADMAVTTSDLLSNCMWCLYVDKDGAVCFSFQPEVYQQIAAVGSGSAKGAKRASASTAEVLRSAEGVVPLTKAAAEAAMKADREDINDAAIEGESVVGDDATQGGDAVGGADNGNRNGSVSLSSKWVQVAVVLDSTRSASQLISVVTPASSVPGYKERRGVTNHDMEDDTQCMVTYSGPVSVALYVNGQRVAAGNLTPSPVMWPELTDSPTSTSTVGCLSTLSSTLFVGPNLCPGWRITELRLWAEARSAADIDACREQFLSVAMKKRRLQQGVKGTKRIFALPLRENIKLPKEAATSKVMWPGVVSAAAIKEAAAAATTSTVVRTSSSSSSSTSTSSNTVFGVPGSLAMPPPTGKAAASIPIRKPTKPSKVSSPTGAAGDATATATGGFDSDPFGDSTPFGDDNKNAVPISSSSSSSSSSAFGDSNGFDSSPFGDSPFDSSKKVMAVNEKPIKVTASDSSGSGGGSGGFDSDPFGSEPFAATPFGSSAAASVTPPPPQTNSNSNSNSSDAGSNDSGGGRGGFGATTDGFGDDPFGAEPFGAEPSSPPSSSTTKPPLVGAVSTFAVAAAAAKTAKAASSPLPSSLSTTGSTSGCKVVPVQALGALVGLHYRYDNGGNEQEKEKVSGSSSSVNNNSGGGVIHRSDMLQPEQQQGSGGGGALYLYGARNKLLSAMNTSCMTLQINSNRHEKSSKEGDTDTNHPIGVSQSSSSSSSTSSSGGGVLFINWSDTAAASTTAASTTSAAATTTGPAVVTQFIPASALLPQAAISADSTKAILSSLLFPVPHQPHHYLLAVYAADKKIRLLKVDPASGPAATAVTAVVSSAVVSEIPMTSTPLVHWSFISATTMLLVSSAAVFTWKCATATTANTTTAPPQIMKVADRVDVAATNSKWEKRTVVDVSVFADGWTMLTTHGCDFSSSTAAKDSFSASSASSSSPSPFEFSSSFGDVRDTSGSNITDAARTAAENIVSSFVVSLHHKTKSDSLAVSFAGALCGCFRAGCVVMVWAVPITIDAGGGAAGGKGGRGHVKQLFEWYVTELSLSDVHSLALNHKNSAGSATAAATVVVRLSDLNVGRGRGEGNASSVALLTCNWSLKLRYPNNNSTIMSGDISSVYPMNLLQQHFSHYNYADQQQEKGSQLLPSLALVHIFVVGTKLFLVRSATNEVHMCGLPLAAAATSTPNSNGSAVAVPGTGSATDFGCVIASPVAAASDEAEVNSSTSSSTSSSHNSNTGRNSYVLSCAVSLAVKSDPTLVLVRGGTAAISLLSLKRVAAALPRPLN